MNEDTNEGVIRIIKIAVTVVAIVAWSVIGFVLWIPLLTRMIAYFVGIVVASSYRKINTKPAQNSLNVAIEFYISGFRRILYVMTDEAYDPAALPAMNNTQPVSLLDFLKSVAAEIVWAIVFWIAVFITSATW
ncbi:hypothetical protein MUP05_06975 [Candidatus Bathyarchaeota archaeon]|nr:hypothetical protein [Candidatus Bathyarchaeota archaeon]